MILALSRSKSDLVSVPCSRRSASWHNWQTSHSVRRSALSAAGESPACRMARLAGSGQRQKFSGTRPPHARSPVSGQGMDPQVGPAFLEVSPAPATLALAG